MDLTTQLTEIVNFFSPYVTKEYILNIFELAKTILIILFFLFIIKSFLKLKLFKRVKLLLKNLIEINNKMDDILDIIGNKKGNKEGNKKAPIIKKFVK